LVKRSGGSEKRKSPAGEGGAYKTALGAEHVGRLRFAEVAASPIR